VSQQYVQDGHRLGSWVSKQRGAYAKGKLEAERVARLEALGSWTWDLLADEWEEGFHHLRRFADREGHARISRKCLEDGYRLGQWVNNQRIRHAEGKIDVDRATRLEAIPGWVWHTKAAVWEEGLGCLSRFVDREGHALVSARYIEDGFPLGKWVGHQRANHSNGQLAADRAARLEAVGGWTWEPFGEEGFEYLYRFVDREGHARVPFLHNEDGYRLDRWVKSQRIRHARGQLGGDRVARLEALPGWVWNKREEE